MLTHMSMGVPYDYTHMGQNIIINIIIITSSDEIQPSTVVSDQ